MKRMFASPGGSVIPGTLWAESCASTEETAPKSKIRIITIGLLRDLSEIKLKRTDTTLDLSQKAKRAKEEKKRKKLRFSAGRREIYSPARAVCSGARQNFVSEDGEARAPGGSIAFIWARLVYAAAEK